MADNQPRPELTASDFDFLRFCEEGLCALIMFAAMAGTPIVQAQRVASGYVGKTERTDFAARTYRDALATPPARETAADRALAEARAWGLSS